MKRIKDKGFTMIELLGVITLLGIIALICIPSVSKLLKNVGNSYYEAIEKNVKSAGIDYYTDNKNLLPDAAEKTALVYVGDKTNSKDSLVGLSYIDKVVDRKENTCGYYGENVLENDNDDEYSYVIVVRKYKDPEKNNATNFIYTSCMHCQGDNYNTSKRENEYCNESWKPKNNQYIKVPKNYYLQISTYDYNRAVLSKVKSDDNQSTYDYFELRKAGIRNNDGQQQTNNTTTMTIAPNHIDLIIDGSDVGDIDSTNKDAAWNDLVNKLAAKMGNTAFQDYLKAHTVKLKLNYTYTYTFGDKEATRTGETYVTLIKEVLEPAGPVTIESYYNDASYELYYSSTPFNQANADGTYSYTYTYNANHKNIDEKYRRLIGNTIINSANSYINLSDVAWINRGVRVNFKAEGASLFECSYDKKTWYPCESGENYNYTFNKDIYVRAISMYGNRGPINRFPIKIDVDSMNLKTTVDRPTGENKWYVKDVNMKGKVTNTTSGVKFTKMCTTAIGTSCEPLIEGSNIDNQLEFTKLHNQETKGITYCYQSINHAGSVSKKVCHSIKLDKTNPVCSDSCEGSSTTWVNTTKEITCGGTDPNSENHSGLNKSYSKKSVTYRTDTKTAIMKYTLKDNAGNTTSCSKSVDVYVDKTPPTVPKVSLSKTTWTKENVEAKASGATDNLSGIQYYEYMGNDGSTLKDYSNSEQHGTTFIFATEVNKGYIQFRTVDNAGNKSAWSSKKYASIDRTPPKCNTTSSAKGWSNKAVTLTGICIDSGSGCKQNRVTKTFNVSTKQEDASAGVVYDNVGHATTCKAPVDIKIDTKKPTCGSCTGGSTSWTKDNRIITCEGNDTGGSGLKSSKKTVTYDKTTKVDTIYYTVIDNAGNKVSCSKNVNVYVDKTKPSCGSCTGGSARWTKNNRTITCTGTDSNSGMKSNKKTVTYSSGTHKQETIKYTVTDNVGNEKLCEKDVNVYVDKEPPIIKSIDLFNHDTCSNSFGVSAKYSVSDNGGSGVSHVEDYWGQAKEKFQSSFLGHAVNRGANTNITSAYGTACYSAGSAATKGAIYYIKIYAKDNAGNEGYYYEGPAYANE